jgi:hypothetical protein
MERTFSTNGNEKPAMASEGGGLAPLRFKRSSGQKEISPIRFRRDWFRKEGGSEHGERRQGLGESGRREITQGESRGFVEEVLAEAERAAG